MSKPTKIILDKQSDLILTNAQIVGPTGIVKSDLPGLVTDLANLDTAIQNEATTRSNEISTERARIDAILEGADVNLNQFREVVAFVETIDLANDQSLLAAISNINLSISAEEAARIAADDELSADLATLQSYVDNTVNDAIAQLTADLDAEEARALLAEDEISSNLTAEIAARIAGDATLSAALTAETAARIADVDAEESRATAAETKLTTDLATEVSARQTAITNEISRATTAEAEIQSSLNSEISRATAAEGVLTSDLAAEVTRATAAEGVLTSDLAAEVTRATAAEGVLQTNINTEASNRAAADATLTSDLAAEVARATAAEGVLTSDLATEVARATAAEGVLQTNIDNQMVRIDAILEGADVNLNTFAEVVAFVNSIDLDNDSSVLNAITEINADIQTEIDRATSSEAALSTSINSVSNRMDNLEQTIDLLPVTDGLTLEVDENNNVIKLKDTVSAPGSGVRTFEGLVKVSSEPSIDANFFTDNLSLVTRGYVEQLVSEEASRAQSVEDTLVTTIHFNEELSSVYNTINSLPNVDEATLAADNENNVIKLKDHVAAPASGVRTFGGVLELDTDRSNEFMANSLITKAYLDTTVGLEAERAQQEEDALQAEIDAIQTDLSDVIAVVNSLPNADGVTISYDETNNIFKLADNVAASSTGIRTFEGLINVGSEPSDNEEFGDLSLVTKGWVTNQVGADFQAALDAETAARIAADSELDGRIVNIVSNTNAPIIDSFTEVVDSLNDEIARAQYAEAQIALDFQNIYTKKVTVFGVPNGVLTTFTLDIPVRIGSEMIYVNGLLMEEGEDYTTIVSSGKVTGVEFLFAPITEMKVRAYGVCGVQPNSLV